MNGHERERLSAYLDGELPPGERVAVDAHLAACSECARFLAVLEAVEESAASLPVSAPESYFDDFPSRVAARLGAVPRSPARLPRWTWAAAAALLLAIVTPLTLRQSRLGTAPAPAPPAQEPTPGGRAKAEARPGPAVPATAARTAAPALLPRRPPAPAPATPAASPQGFASAPKSEPPMPVAARPERADTEAIPAEPVDAGRASRAELGKAGPEAESVLDVSGAPARRERGAHVTASLEASANEARGPGGRAVAADEGGRNFRRLDAVRPTSAAEWRRLRDDWRALAAAHPEGRRGDEARVRAIEAACQAWLASGDERDEEAFRLDAAAYLGAADAQQKPRVERLVATPRPRP